MFPPGPPFHAPVAPPLLLLTFSRPEGPKNSSNCDFLIPLSQVTTTPVFPCVGSLRKTSQPPSVFAQEGSPLSSNSPSGIFGSSLDNRYLSSSSLFSPSAFQRCYPLPPPNLPPVVRVGYDLFPPLFSPPPRILFAPFLPFMEKPPIRLPPYLSREWLLTTPPPPPFSHWIFPPTVELFSPPLSPPYLFLFKTGAWLARLPY